MLIKRNACILDNKFKIYQYNKIPNFPVKMGCESTLNNSKDIFADMVWGISSSGMLQLMELVPPFILYSDYHNPGSTGKLWENHHKEFFKFIGDISSKSVLEIGGLSGNLSKHFLETDSNFTIDIIEPSTNVNLKFDQRITHINDFFESCKFSKKYDVIIHSHVIEHIFNPVEFLVRIGNILDKSGEHYISFPNMKYWLSNNYSNTLNFEHTYYIDDNVIQYLLHSTGFCIETCCISNHSIFIKAKKCVSSQKKSYDFSYIAKLFTSYQNYILKDCFDVISKIKSLNSPVFLFGAHIFSQILIYNGLDERYIITILDNDITKHSKRLYGTNLLVASPEILVGLNAPIVVVRNGIYSDEVKFRITSINQSTIFI